MQGPVRRLSLLPALAGSRCSAAAACNYFLAQPLAGEGNRAYSSLASLQTVEAEPVDESWWREIQAANADFGGGDGGGGQVPGQQQQRFRWRDLRLDAPIDAPRTLKDYQKMVLSLSRRKRAYLIRDLVDEMSLNGIRPDRFVLQTGLFACMKNRKVGDAMHFFEEMKRRGMQPDSAAYGTAISACGRSGQLAHAVELRDEMLGKGLPMTHNIQLALLHTFAEAGRMRQARETFDDLRASGHLASEFAYAGLVNCYRHMSAKALPSDVEQQLLNLLQQFKEERAASEQQQRQQEEDEAKAQGSYLVEQAASAGAADQQQQQQRHFQPRGGNAPPYSALLVVFNAVLNSLVELGYHQTAKGLYSSMGAEHGLAPDHTTYSNIIRSHVQQALGRNRQPASDALTLLVDERLRSADLAADCEAVLAEEAHLAAAVRQAQGRAAGAAAAEGAAAAAAHADPGPAAAVVGDDSSMVGGDGVGEEVEARPGEAAFLNGSRSSSGAALEGDGEDSAAAPLAPEPPSSSPLSPPPPASPASSGGAPVWIGEQRAGPHGSRGSAGSSSSSQVLWSEMSPDQLQQVVLARAAQRARSRLRFDIFRQHLDLDSWYEALHLFQEVLDQGLVWGPDITYAMIKASLDLQAAGVEDSMAVAHTVMDTFDRQGLFVDVENGTEVLLLAVRRDVGDLSLAHRVYDNMRRTQRTPKTPCLYKYMRALAQREPQSTDRLLEVCTIICSDPERSENVMQMKNDAFKQRQALQKAGQGGRERRHSYQGQAAGGSGGSRPS